MIVEGAALPATSRVVRYVGFNKMRKDADDNPLCPEYSAFAQRPDEDYLSVTWCEYFGGLPDTRIRCAVEAIRASKIDVRPKACFCVGTVSRVLGAVGDKTGRAGRAVFLPEEDNPAHAGIFGVDPNDTILLARIADEIWCSFLTKDAVDSLPLESCIKAENVA